MNNTIVHIITTTNVGGAETMLYRLLSNIGVSRRTLVVCLLPVGPIGKMLTEVGVDVESLHMRKGVPDPTALFRLCQLIHVARPKLVVSWLYHADLMAVVAKMLGAKWPLLWNLRGSSRYFPGDPVRIPLIHRTLAFLSRLPAGVIVNSESGLRYHESIGYRPRRWHLLPNGIDVTRFKPDVHMRAKLRAELGLGDQVKLILLPARYHPMKGHKIFLAAAAKLAAKRSDVEFLLAGNSITRGNIELHDIVTQHGLTDRVHFLGVRTDMERLYAGTEIVTLPSLWGEGFPNVLGEAMACGTPCVASDIGDSARIIGQAGIVIKAGDVEALYQSWDRLLNLSEPERTQLGNAARHSIENRFSLPEIVSEYNRIFRAYVDCA